MRSELRARSRFCRLVWPHCPYVRFESIEDEQQSPMHTAVKPEKQHRSSLSQHLLNQSSPNSGEALVQSLIEVRKPRMIQAHEMQNCGVQIGHVTRVFHSLETKLVGGPDCLASFQSCTGEPHAK